MSKRKGWRITVLPRKLIRKTEKGKNENSAKRTMISNKDQKLFYSYNYIIMIYISILKNNQIVEILI